mgnify:FL=1
MDKVSLLPADMYTVVSKTILNLEDRDNLIMLYEPIMGPLAVSLYLTLWRDLKNNSFKSEEYNHHHLMCLMKLDLKSIKEARCALESLGLLKTYVKQGDIYSYVYELYSPMSPREFLNHPVLNVVLYNNIGKMEYDAIKKSYEKKSMSLSEYEDITSSLNMTFASSNVLPEVDATERVKQNIQAKNVIDFDMLIASIPKDILNEKAFNKRTRELIENLAFVYNLDTIKFSEIIKNVINERGFIVAEELRKLARNYYTYHNNGKLPTLVYKEEKTGILENMSKRDKIIYVFENTKPYDFLKSKYHGVTPTNRDLKLLETLCCDLNLKPAVVNVLIDYVLKKNDNKLNKNFVETIAGQWVRSGIKTAREAMSLAEKEQKKLIAKAPTNIKTPEDVPVWFKTEIKRNEATLEEQKELEELMKGTYYDSSK